MGQGLRVWNAAGKLMLDVTDPISRLSGTVNIPAGSTGSVNVPNASQGTIWYAVISTGTSNYYPGVSISGSTLSWGPSTLFTPAVDAILIYGVF